MTLSGGGVVSIDCIVGSIFKFLTRKRRGHRS